MTEERRHDASKLDSLATMMAQHHASMQETLAVNREFFTHKTAAIIDRLDSEIPEGHGEYHRKLIASAARRQSLHDAIAHKVAGWAAVGALAALAAWGWDWITSHFKP